MKITESSRKYILLGFVLFIVGGMITANVLAKKQDTTFLEDDMLYQQAQQFLSEGNLVEAGVYIRELQERQPNSEAVNYLAAVIAANDGSYTLAVNLYTKTLDINPHLVEDPMFMLQFAEMLVSADRKEDARRVLLHCQQWGWVPEEFPTYQERVTELLTQVDAG